MGGTVVGMCSESEGSVHISPGLSSLEDWAEIAIEIIPKIRSWYTDFVT